MSLSDMDDSNNTLNRLLKQKEEQVKLWYVSISHQPFLWFRNEDDAVEAFKVLSRLQFTIVKTDQVYSFSYKELEDQMDAGKFGPLEFKWSEFPEITLSSQVTDFYPNALSAKRAKNELIDKIEEAKTRIKIKKE